MARTKLTKHLFTIILVLSSLVSFAQSEVESTTEIDSTQYDEVRSLVNFYEYILNAVGSGKTSTRDKEVIIRESYKKIFIDQDVQVEDDLILDRKVITNKDVSAYLRDVDFFFKEIQFDFVEIQVKKIYKEDSSFYFLASFENNETGTTIEGLHHSSIKKRFIEVNFNEDTNDLKIASVYSTKLSRAKELQIWWESLSYNWQNIFQDYIPFDSISFSALKKIAAIDSLDLSGNQYIINIEPISALRDLKVLDISYSKISDLTPLRYTRNLQKLSAAYTPITDISAFQYIETLVDLDLSHSEVLDISSLDQQKELKLLDLSNTKIVNFESLKNLENLVEINFSNSQFTDPSLLSASTTLQIVNLSRTEVTDLSAIKELTQLRELGVSETKITSLAGLENHSTLEVVAINQTDVSELSPLVDLPKLKKVYADHSGITEDMASQFMTQKSGTVVVTNSEQVIQWWSSLPANWKTVFNEIIHVDNPTKEDIVKLLNLDSLDLSNKNLSESTPLVKFKRLTYLNVSENQFQGFSFTSNMGNLAHLIGVGLSISSTNGLEKNRHLKILNLNSSKLEDIESLSQLNKLEILEADNSKLTDVQVVKCLELNAGLVIVYQSETLDSWWADLSSDWKNAFNLEAQTTYELHQLIEQKEITISSHSISSLVPLDVFINLEKISLDGVRITNLNELYRHHGLRELSFTNGPLQTLEGITQFDQLELLNISNTAIEDLKSLSEMSSLRHLNCSGTSIKNLKAITRLYDLESIDMSNTRIWRLEWLYEMKNMKTVICNNTRLSQQKVDAYQLLFPDCEVTFY